MISLSSIARKLGISVEELEKRALRALLREELRRIMAEKAVILARYKVRDFNELWHKIEKDEIDDTIVHNDIARLDYLEHREIEIRKLQETTRGV